MILSNFSIFGELNVTMVKRSYLKPYQFFRYIEKYVFEHSVHQKEIPHIDCSTAKRVVDTTPSQGGIMIFTPTVRRF